MDSTSNRPPTPSKASWVEVTGVSLSTSGPPETTPTGQKTPTTKRRKEARERCRVSRACDRCKSKKTRCTGRLPCPLCVRAGLKCEYTASYTRGRVPSVIIDETAVAAATQPRLSMQIQTPASEPSTEGSMTPSIRFAHFSAPQANMDRASTGNVYSTRDRVAVPGDDTVRDPLSRSSPEPTQTDQQGHYIGPSSGVSFLLRVQKKLHENSSLSHDSSIFTFGDAPLPEFDPTFFVLPPKADGQRLVERYFDFAAPTHRFLHRPTIEKMLHEFYETQGDMRNKEDAASKTALLLIVFAQAQAYMPPGISAEDNSARYYFAAEHQLGKERGAVRLASVQARLVQCYYLLAQSRINQCWSLFGTTAHLALAIGLNRGRRGDACGKTDYIEVESRRRTFWSAYVLDKFLAAALGRPSTLRDEDIDQELPTVVNDDDLHSSSMTPSPSKVQSIMLAPVEHIKLSQIVSHVLRDLYPIRPPTIPHRVSLAAKYTQALQKWRSRNSGFLDAEGVHSSLLIPVYQRQRNVLNLAYYHAMLLVHRPFLISNFASLANIDARPGQNQLSNTDFDTTHSKNITACLDAAMGIVHIVDDIFQGSQILRAFWFTQYYAFCAVVVLYIYRIQQHIVEPGKCEGWFNAGQRCQAQLSTLSDTDCLSKRYCLVLEELRLEANRRTDRVLQPLPPATHASSSASPRVEVDGLARAQGDVSSSDNAFSSAFFGGTDTVPPTPESSAFSTSWLGNNTFMEDFTSWGQFDSLVTAGIGVLDGVVGQGDGGIAGGFGR